MDDETRDIYLKTLKQNDKDKKNTKKGKRQDNYMGSMSKVLKHNKRSLKKHYRNFMSYIDYNNISTYQDMKKI